MNDYKLEPPEPVVVGRCFECGHDIHEDELIREVDGYEIHDFGCFLDYMEDKFPLKNAGRE